MNPAPRPWDDDIDVHSDIDEDGDLIARTQIDAETFRTQDVEEMERLAREFGEVLRHHIFHSHDVILSDTPVRVRAVAAAYNIVNGKQQGYRLPADYNDIDVAFLAFTWTGAITPVDDDVTYWAQAREDAGAANLATLDTPTYRGPRIS